MQELSGENHAAAAAWVAGGMDPAQRQEFAAHLASCAQCQAQVAALRAARPRRGPRRLMQILAAAIVTLIVGFALGWWLWHLAHR